LLGCAKHAGEPVFTITESLFFPSLDSVLANALVDPALFHAIFLSLTMAANDWLYNVECYYHKDKLLTHISERINDPLRMTQYETLICALILLTIEVRRNAKLTTVFESDWLAFSIVRQL
jgi:hypothetical protein